MNARLISLIILAVMSLSLLSSCVVNGTGNNGSGGSQGGNAGEGEENGNANDGDNSAQGGGNASESVTLAKDGVTLTDATGAAYGCELNVIEHEEYKDRKYSAVNSKFSAFLAHSFTLSKNGEPITEEGDTLYKVTLTIPEEYAGKKLFVFLSTEGDDGKESTKPVLYEKDGDKLSFFARLGEIYVITAQSSGTHIELPKVDF